MKRAIFLLVHFIRQLFQIHFQIFVHNKPPLFLRSAAQRNGARQPTLVRQPAATFSGSVLPLRMAAAAPSESSAQLRRSMRPRVQTHSKAASFPAQQQSCAQRGFHPHPRRPPENIGPGASVRAGPESASPGCSVPGSCRAGSCSGRPGGGSSAVRWPASLPPAAGFGTSGRRNLLWWRAQGPLFESPGPVLVVRFVRPVAVGGVVPARWAGVVARWLCFGPSSRPVRPVGPPGRRCPAVALRGSCGAGPGGLAPPAGRGLLFCGDSVNAAWVPLSLLLPPALVGAGVPPLRRRLRTRPARFAAGLGD